MQLTVSGKNFDIGDSLRGHVQNTLTALVEKYFGEALEAFVMFSQEAPHAFSVDISAHVIRGITLQSHASAADALSAYQEAADKLDKRLRRHKSRVRNHHTKIARKEIEAFEAQKFIISAEAEEEELVNPDGSPAIIAEMSMPIETLTVADAVMRLDIGNLTALLFRNAAHGELNMIYRRSDGNISWVDPSVKKSAA